MPATPPPPSPPPASPPTSPQLHQQAIRNQERLQRDGGSPELRRVPSTSTTLSTIFPPLLSPPRPISAPVNFNGQSFSHLPPHIAAGLRNLQQLPVRACRARPLPQSRSNVSFISPFFYIYSITC